MAVAQSRDHRHAQQPLDNSHFRFVTMAFRRHGQGGGTLLSAEKRLFLLRLKSCAPRRLITLREYAAFAYTFAVTPLIIPPPKLGQQRYSPAT